MVISWVLAPSPVVALERDPALDRLRQARTILASSEEPRDLDRAIRLLEADMEERERAEVLVLLAQACVGSGQAMADRRRALGEFDRALRFSERAMGLDPRDPAPHYWRGLALLWKAGILRNAVSLRLVRAALAEMEYVAARDDGYDEAGAYRVIGKVYLESPPGLFGLPGEAVEYLERARDRAPDSLANRLYLAQAYLADGRRSDALGELAWILGAEPRPQSPQTDLTRQRTARLLLACIQQATGPC